MNYYLLSPIGIKSPPLIYKNEQVCERGDICSIELRGKTLLGVIICLCQKPSFACKNMQILKNYLLPHQTHLAYFIAQYYCVELGEAFELFCSPLSLIHHFSNFLQDSQELHLHSPLPSITFHDTKISLNSNQKKALEFLHSHTNPLLFGDTGSGKTEIYIHLIMQTLHERGSALFLMPEIALTPQMESRLKAVFGDMVAIWHSKITIAHKKQILHAIQKGEVRVIAGARSALFLPIPNLKLIIVDEEHDDAYKSQTLPHYNARDLALYLGNLTLSSKNIPPIKTILGSATPSLSSYERARKQGTMYRLKGRYFGSSKQIIIVPPPPLSPDIAEESKWGYEEQRILLQQEHAHEIISPQILEVMAKKLDKKEQIIVFLPTRAHYKMLLCMACGAGIQCEFCSVYMSLHRDKNAMVCHYCHSCKPIPKNCPQCTSSLYAHRIGTASIKHILTHMFPNARIALFDRDSITTHKKLTTTLKAFNKGEIDILVGTQMLSKGHDYHRVNLAVILGIDYILKSTDYRCNERALSLLYQIAGRSGRKEHGEVYVQSNNGKFLTKLMEDYEDFLLYEIQTRPHLYPPFVRLATITIAHKNETKALEALSYLRENLLCFKDDEVEMVGDSKALLERLHGKFRFIVLLRSKNTKALLQTLHCIKTHAGKFERLYEIDIDPLSVI